MICCLPFLQFFSSNRCLVLPHSVRIFLFDTPECRRLLIHRCPVDLPLIQVMRREKDQERHAQQGLDFGSTRFTQDNEPKKSRRINAPCVYKKFWSLLSSVQLTEMGHIQRNLSLRDLGLLRECFGSGDGSLTFCISWGGSCARISGPFFGMA